MRNVNIQQPTSNNQRTTGGLFDFFGCSTLVGERWLFLILFSVIVPTLFGQSGSESDESGLKLLPPYGELPPTFWEQHGATVIVGALALAAVVGFVIWFCLRPKPAVIVPSEIQAREALRTLLNRPEDGALLSGVSQVLRRYVIAAFELPPGEPTTSEFCRTLADNDKIGSELSTAVAEFLRRCDEHKFSPQNSQEPMGAPARALELVELGEARRAQLRQQETAQTQTASAPHA